MSGRVSPKTIANVKRVFDGLAGRVSDFRDLLYEHNFPEWFIQQVYVYARNWMDILWALRNGRFFYPSSNMFAEDMETILPEELSDANLTELGEFFIQKLAAFAFVYLDQLPSTYTDVNLRKTLPRALELDGFAVDTEKVELVPLEGPVSAKEEEDRLTSLVKNSGLPQSRVILKHIQDASSLYTEANDHPSLNESRSLIQSLIDGISTETDKHGKHSTKLPGPMKDRIEYLTKVGFLVPDEEAALKAGWASLSAGSHPGVPEREQARIGLILALEFGQLLLIKFTNWENNAYKCFK
jgi:hypothetical protein